MNTQKFKQKLSSLRGLSNIPQFIEDPDCIIESKKLLDDLYYVMLNQRKDYGIKWMFGLRRYIDDKKRSLNRRFTGHLDRGHIVETELFGHFNQELSFIHPAVVLHDNNSGWILVAPVSTTKHGDNDPLHVDVDTRDGFNHECAVCLDDIRVIDKNRILYQHSKNRNNRKVRSLKLDELDLAILEHYLPVTNKRLNDKIGELENKINELQKDLDLELETHEKTKEKVKILQDRLDTKEEVAISEEIS